VVWLALAGPVLASGSENGGGPAGMALEAQGWEDEPAAVPPPSPVASSVDPRKEADIRLLLELTGAVNLSRQVMAQMLVQLQKMAPEVPASFWGEFEREIGTDGLVALMIPVYDRNLSHADLKEMIRFYQSPAGRRITAALPVIAKEAMEAGQQWGRTVAERALRRAREHRFTDKTL